MENGRKNSPDISSKLSKWERIKRGVDIFFYGEKLAGNNNQSKQSKLSVGLIEHSVSPESRDEGFNELRFLLRDRITVFVKIVESAKRKDTLGFSKKDWKIGPSETKAKARYDHWIKRGRNAMSAINAGKGQEILAIDFLKDQIEEAIKDSNYHLFMPNLNAAQEGLNIMWKIDPYIAIRLQKKLDKKLKSSRHLA